MSVLIYFITGLSIFLAFTLSASAGLGGSLILVPALALVLGPKQGIAMATLLLTGNNVAKVIAYRSFIEFKPPAFIIAMTAVGAMMGATFMLQMPESVVHVAILVMFAATFLFESLEARPLRKASWASLCALAAGATSGFSGTSGPLKGVALRTLELDRQRFVAAASVVSLVGDLTKATVFAANSVYANQHLLLAAATIPLAALATWLGRGANRRIGERGYKALFWTVMTAYSLRLIL
jgi:uncharacterized membrane protein YfcA